MRALLSALITVAAVGLLRAEPEEKPEAFRAQAQQLEEEGKIDETIDTYARMFTKPESAADLVTQAQDLEVWMRLLWKRNKPETEKEESDRKAALQAGKNFMQTAKKLAGEKLNEEELKAWKRVEQLVAEYEMELDWEKKFSWYLGRYEETDNPEEKGETLLLMIELLMEHKEYKRAAERCREFLDKKNDFGASKFKSARAAYYLGSCLEEMGAKDDAIAWYARTWSTHMGMIEASAPAMERWMRLLWQRNNPERDQMMSDRQGAYEGGRQYIELTERFEDKMREVDHRLWKRVKDLAEAYQAELDKKGLLRERGVLRDG